MTDKLTPHFTWVEATHSDTAQRLGLKNDPPVTARTAIEVAAFMMEAARSLCDNRPVNVTSWYPSQDRVHLSAAPGRRREVMTKTTRGYIAGLVAP